MVQSRCGLKCSECEYASVPGCDGCLNGSPFWGECRIAACCEGKGLEHCGLCGEFPCKKLNEFAYDEEQGDNGQRIENLREWMN